MIPVDNHSHGPVHSKCMKKYTRCDAVVSFIIIVRVLCSVHVLQIGAAIMDLVPAAQTM